MSILLLAWAVGFSFMIAYDVKAGRVYAPRTVLFDAAYVAGALVWPVLALWALSEEFTNATPRGD